jgi:hypothetical protein
MTGLVPLGAPGKDSNFPFPTLVTVVGSSGFLFPDKCKLIFFCKVVFIWKLNSYFAVYSIKFHGCENKQRKMIFYDLLMGLGSHLDDRKEMLKLLEFWKPDIAEVEYNASV